MKKPPERGLIQMTVGARELVEQQEEERAATVGE
jgi:hypothetical protein